MNVFVLATCRKPELLAYTTLVFKTLRTGFPTAKVFVHGNALPAAAKKEVKAQCKAVKAKFLDHPATIHHLWVEQLCETQVEPFVLLDTDVIFFAPVEQWQFEKSLAGWRIPEFQDEFTNARTRARLHTSLLFVNPVQLREDITKWRAQFPVTPFNPLVNLFHPLCVPFKNSAYFYDTAAMLYHAVGGQSFTDAQLENYAHFNFGTIADLVLPRLRGGAEMAVAREAVLNNPAMGKGMWRSQLQWYQNRQPMMT